MVGITNRTVAARDICCVNQSMLNIGVAGDVKGVLVTIGLLPSRRYARPLIGTT